MHAVLALSWREYRELRWSVLAAACILLVPPLAYLCRGQVPWASDAVSMALMAYPFFGGAFFGMRAAAGERGGHTAAFVNALPVRPVTLGIVRLLATLIAVLLPLAALVAVCVALLPHDAQHFRPTGQTMLPQSMAWSLLTTCLVAACGLGAPSELKAAGRGLAVPVGCLLALVIGAYPLRMLGLLNQSLAYWIAIGIEGLSSFLRNHWDALMPLITIGLATAFIWCYRSAIGPPPVAGTGPSRGWIPAGLRSRSAALLLKAMREEGPRFAAVMLAAIAPAIFLGVQEDRGLFFLPNGGIFVTIGAVAALVMGIATFAADLDPRINTFWRSLPISPTRWFWTKYTAAFVTFLIMLALPQIVWMAGEMPLERLRRSGLGFGMAAAYWFGSFSAGVAAICLVRRPLPAGIFAMGLAVAMLCSIDWPLFLYGPQPSSHTAIILGGIVAASIAGTLAAWWATSRDVAFVR
jgi:hypothetical protein